MRRNPEFERLLVPAEFRLLDAGAGAANLVEGYASVFGNVDAYNDVVEPGAFRKTITERVAAGKVPLLDTHVWDAAHTLGTVLWAEEDSKGLHYRAALSSAPSVRDIRQKMIEGHISRNSIGYESIREHYSRQAGTPAIRHLDEIKLYEISVVPLAANEEATIIGVKAVVPFQDLPLAPRDQAWDAAAARDRVLAWSGGGEDVAKTNFARYRRAFVWFDAQNPDQLGSYKFPIADIAAGNELRAVPRAIFAAAAVIQGSRGGAQIPLDDVDAVKAHVSRYYARMRDEFGDQSIVAPWQQKQPPAPGSSPGAQITQIAQITEKTKSGYSIIEIREAVGALLAALKHEDRQTLIYYLAAQLARMELPAGPDSPPTDKPTASEKLSHLRRRELELRAELTKRRVQHWN